MEVLTYFHVALGVMVLVSPTSAVGHGHLWYRRGERYGQKAGELCDVFQVFIHRCCSDIVDVGRHYALWRLNVT